MEPILMHDVSGRPVHINPNDVIQMLVKNSTAILGFDLRTVVAIRAEFLKRDIRPELLSPQDIVEFFKG